MLRYSTRSCPTAKGEVRADAVRVLTEAARLTNQPRRQGVSGDWEADPNGTPLPIDWAAFVTEALAGAAANIGGTTEILAGRPGSWDAAKVREVLESTVGVDVESLWEHRTEPVTVSLWVENILLDLDDATLEQHDAALTELYERQDAIPQPDDVDYTPAFDWLADSGWINDPEKVAAVEKLNAELAARPPTPGQLAEQAAVGEVDELCRVATLLVALSGW